MEIAAVAPDRFQEIAFPLIGMFVFCFLITVVLLFKFGVVAALGSPSLTRRIGCAFAVALDAGGTILLSWPD